VTDTETFEALRNRLSDVDKSIVELVAERQRIVADIGRFKQSEGRALRDFKREKVVIEAALAHAEAVGVEEALVEDIVRTLIRYSLTSQEKDYVSNVNRGAGRQVLVIGGAGQMGRWFAAMLASQGFAVDIADPAVEDGQGLFRRWEDAGVDYDIIVVAAPIARCGEILSAIAERKPKGLVLDIASLKTPLRAGIDALRDAGCKVASLHPMFGPETELLSHRHLIFVDAGCPEATAAARELFEGTMVEQIDLSLDDHDRMIAYVLGLSHALNIAFFDALRRSGEAAGTLIQMSSTTFDAQLLVSGAVARENPDLYFEIQKLNEYGHLALDALCESSERLRDVVAGNDRAAFADIMSQGQSYFALRRRPTEQVPSQRKQRRRASGQHV